jgi:hypothetical protein
MTAMRPISSACFALALALVGYLAWATFDVVAESYGSGPPYYGRTTNMDKWTSPVPGLLAIDLPGLGIAGGLIYLGLRLRSRFAGASRP